LRPNGDSGPSVARHLGLIGLFLVCGIPLVAYLWETVHQVLSLEVDSMRLLISVPLLVIFILLMRFVGRRMGGQEKT
jgi:hypothetical protein